MYENAISHLRSAKLGLERAMAELKQSDADLKSDLNDAWGKIDDVLDVIKEDIQ